MLLVIVRTLVLFALVVVVMRLMGKRQVGQLQPYELVVVILISELASVPMEDTGIPLFAGVIPILLLLMASITISYVSLKSERARAIICGKPTVVIDRGQIMYQDMEKLRYSMTDMLEQLRIKNIPNISDVEFAILETNGELSIIPKSQKRPVIPEDLQLATKYEGLPFTLILDGKVKTQNLAKAKLDRQWLDNELKRYNVTSISQVVVASLDSTGKLFVQAKNSDAKILH
ncbi:MAG: DUF421 domain-containing protein [Peptococcaceae bacterium]|nr:DUF421 domain-containing protein [Peptococcaceae bacterium]